jgi:hypothetical protein
MIGVFFAQALAPVSERGHSQASKQAKTPPDRDEQGF